MTTFRIIPDKEVQSNDIKELFRELHNYQSLWQRKQNKKISGSWIKDNRFCFEIVIEKEDVGFYLTSSNNNDIDIIKKNLKKSTITEQKYNLSIDNNTAIRELELKYHYFLSLSTDGSQLEPIGSLLEIQKMLKDNENVIIQYIFSPENYEWGLNCSEAYQKFKDGIMSYQLRLDKNELINNCAKSLAHCGLVVGELVQEIILGDESQVKKIKIEDNDISKILRDKKLSRSTLEKAKFNAYNTTIRLISHSDNIDCREQLLHALEVSYNTIRLDNYLISKKIISTERYIKRVQERKLSITPVRNILTTEETAKLCFLPQVTLQNLFKMQSIDMREVEIPSILLNGSIPIGIAIKNGNEKSVYWQDDYNIMGLPKIVVGGMGSGKSEVTITFTVCASRINHGAIVLDYIKDCELSRKMEQYIPKDKLIIIDLSDVKNLSGLAFPEVKLDNNYTSFDLIRNVSDLSEQVLYLINALNDGTAQPLTPKMTRLLDTACKVTFMTGRIKIYDVINMLQNYKIRHEIIDDVISKKLFLKDDIKILDLLSLDEIDSKGKVCGTKETKIENIMDRINILVRNPYLEMMLKSEPNYDIDFVKYMNDGKIVLIRMPEGVFKKKWIKDVLTTYFLSRIWLSAQIRGSTQKQPRTVHVITDEIHQAETASKLIAENICEGRKFGISYYFTCQYLKQFKTLLDGVEGAGASYMLLKGTHKENYQMLKEELGDFQIDELLNMKKWCSVNLIQTSEGVKTFISHLPTPL
jgi:hypothetical protein